MNVLAIDTASAVCRIGLCVGDEVFTTVATEQRDHARLLLPMLASLLDEAELDSAQLDLIAWNAGPGSFTGLRIAASAVQALAYAHQLPVVNLSSLALLAHSAQLAEGERAFCVLDARMASVYVAAYQMQAGKLQPLLEEQLLSLEECKALLQQCAYSRLLGADCSLLGVVGEPIVVTPQHLLDLAAGVEKSSWGDALSCAPRYLRDATQWQKRVRIRP